MKNQNPHQILNEILLRMKYDVSKTLTENINEQQTIQVKNNDVYPGPRKTTLSSYSSGNIGQDSDVVNSSEFPQYKYKEINKQRQIQSDNWLRLKNEAYRKVVDAVKNGTADTIQKAWNEFVYAYKHLYRDKDQWEDYKTLQKIINNSKKLKINNGIVSNVQTKTNTYKPEFSLDNYLKQRQLKVKNAFGEKEPIKPEEPFQDGKDGKTRCPVIYDSNYGKPVMWVYNNTCYNMTRYGEMMEKYQQDLITWGEEHSIWEEANPKVDFSTIYTNAEEQIKEKNKWRNDLTAQRDVFASYRNETDRQAVISTVQHELEKLGIDWKSAKTSGNNDLLWETFLGFRSFWNHWGPQIFTAAITLAPETLGLSEAAALFLDLGVDTIIFLIDFIESVNNPDDNDSWTRLVEDATSLAFYGSFTGLGQAIKLAGKNKQIKTLRNFLNSQWTTIKPTIIKALKWVEEKISGSTKIPSKIGNWFISKIKSLYKWFDDFVVGKVGSKVAPLFTVALPMVSAFFIVLKLNEKTVAKFLEPAIERLIGVPISRIREIAQGSLPNDDESEKLSNVNLPEEIKNEINKNDQVITTTQQASDNIQSKKEKTKELVKTKSGQKEQLQRTINVMTGPCKEYFQSLLNKNNLELIVSTDNGAVLTSYEINKEKGYYLDMFKDPTTVDKYSSETATYENLDCSKELNKLK